LPKPAVLGLNLKAQGHASHAKVMAINFCNQRLFLNNNNIVYHQDVYEVFNMSLRIM